MIKKSILFVFSLLAIYQIYVFVSDPNWNKGENQWQENIIKAQRFLYDSVNTSSVIIGTSLSCRLVQDSLPEIFNLGFHGQSVLDGLEVIKRKSDLPRIIFIETNFISNSKNKEFTRSLVSPIAYYKCKYISCLRDKYRPIGLLSTLNKDNSMTRIITKASMKIIILLNRNFFIKNDLFKYQLGLNKKKSEDKLKDGKKQCMISLHILIKNLKKETDYLENNGVKIIFFEMPVDKEISEMPYTKLLREVMNRFYPRDNYVYVEQPDFNLYQTTDGIHLTTFSAIKYSSYLSKQLRKY